MGITVSFLLPYLKLFNIICTTNEVRSQPNFTTVFVFIDIRLFGIFFLPFGVASCCASIQLVPYDAVNRNKVSICQLPLFYFPSHSLHVSAPTGHLQVRYTIRFFLKFLRTIWNSLLFVTWKNRTGMYHF
jgi:hypothetical protein